MITITAGDLMFGGMILVAAVFYFILLNCIKAP